MKEQKGHAVRSKDVAAANKVGTALYKAHIERERKQTEVQMRELSMNAGYGAPPGLENPR